MGKSTTCVIHRTGLCGAAYALIAMCCLVPSAFAHWKEKVLYSFQGGTDGAVPAGGVVFDKSGNLYGATEDGGANGCNSPGPCGTVFELSPPAAPGGTWTETVLYVFKGQAYGDGATPEGSVIIDNAGNLYGTTGYGGTGPCTLLGGPVGCGTVYELSPPAKVGDSWTEKVLYSFQGGNDGYVATGSLVFDKSGNLYGATLFGGGQGTTCDPLYGGNCGTIFKLSTPQTKGAQWGEKVLHSFAGGTDGAVPNGGLVLDRNEALFGTTVYGGNETGRCNGGIEGIGCGTAFVVVPPRRSGEVWLEKPIYVFLNGTDGADPSTGLIFGPRDALFGAAQGGAKGGGVLFSLTFTPTGYWNEAAIYQASTVTYGYSPAASLFDPEGHLYGTTQNDPRDGLPGTIYRMQRPSESKAWVPVVLYRFQGTPDGASPTPNLLRDSAGNLYGTTSSGGSGTGCSFHGCGTVFEVSEN